MPTPRRSLFIAAQLIAAALLIWFVGGEFIRQWKAFRAEPLEITPQWVTIVAAGATVLGTYALLIQVWRVLMAGGGASLRFWPAARIWTVSNLWRYVPGKLWSIGAMAAMAHRENVPPAAAASASVLGVVLNIGTGLAISMLVAWGWMGEHGMQAVGVGLLVAAALGVVSLPYTLPRLAALASRIAQRDVRIDTPPTWAIALAVAGNLLSWTLYGLAFSWLARGLGISSGGATWQYIAVFTASYVAGYIILIAPGGLGPRELVMTDLLLRFGLATPKEAVLLTVASRLWLTVLEIVPGLLFLLFGRGSRPLSTPSNARDVPRQ